ARIGHQLRNLTGALDAVVKRIHPERTDLASRLGSGLVRDETPSHQRDDWRHEKRGKVCGEARAGYLQRVQPRRNSEQRTPDEKTERSAKGCPGAVSISTRNARPSEKSSFKAPRRASM